MRNHYKFAMLCALWLTHVGCERTQESRKAQPPSELRFDQVLKTDDDAKMIVTKAVKAHGGEKAFTRWSCGFLKYKSKGDLVPAQRSEVTFEDTFQLPGHFKREIHTDVDGKELWMVFVVNHGKGWTKKGDTPAEPSDNNFTEKTEHPFAGFCDLSILTEAEVRLTKLGMEKVSGMDSVGVRAHSEKLGEIDFHFGVQTGLLLKIKKVVPSTDSDKPRVLETYLGDYKDVQGNEMSMRIKLVQDGKAILDINLIEARFVDEFDKCIFAKP